MPITGFLKIPDINGESQNADHEDEIDIHGLSWAMERRSSAAVGRGRTRSRAEVDSLVVQKFTDAASVYLALACLQGKSFDKITVYVRKDSGDAHLDYLVFELSNVVISGVDMSSQDDQSPAEHLEEEVSFDFEKVKVLYTVQADDHSSGDEHEIEFDIAAGA